MTEMQGGGPGQAAIIRYTNNQTFPAGQIKQFGRIATFVEVRHPSTPPRYRPSLWSSRRAHYDAWLTCHVCVHHDRARKGASRPFRR
ncbi:hypothetical protein RV134_210179 [Roseovarius sp. EC-HK134]|nr:hypothetical protein RV134_210179 [Roseovarius sp. EC-HK134]VVT01713.1 hypothetical protein RV420_260044 [Roseovarius sp. EC-SD190]